MNKADLIEKVSKAAGINKSQADAAINSLLSGIQEIGRASCRERV